MSNRYCIVLFGTLFKCQFRHCILLAGNLLNTIFFFWQKMPPKKTKTKSLIRDMDEDDDFWRGDADFSRSKPAKQKKSTNSQVIVFSIKFQELSTLKKKHFNYVKKCN